MQYVILLRAQTGYTARLEKPNQRKMPKCKVFLKAKEAAWALSLIDKEHLNPKPQTLKPYYLNPISLSEALKETHVGQEPENREPSIPGEVCRIQPKLLFVLRDQHDRRGTQAGKARDPLNHKYTLNLGIRLVGS